MMKFYQLRNILITQDIKIISYLQLRHFDYVLIILQPLDWTADVVVTCCWQINLAEN